MKALIVRDNRYKKNWGCRSTSIALTQIVSSYYEIIGSIGNSVDINRRVPVGDREDFIETDPQKSLENFLKHYNKNDELTDIHRKVLNSDIIFINGEGSFIFCTPSRRDLLFSLFIIQLCKHFDKKVCVINSMLSDCPTTGRNEELAHVTQQQLNKCDKVFFRDPISQKIGESLGILNSNYVPDALFHWAKIYSDFLNDDPNLYPEMFASWPEEQFLFKAKKLPDEYICLSGASFHPFLNRGEWDSFFHKLTKKIKSATDLPLIMIQPGGDYFLKDIAEETDSIALPADGNILLNMLVLSKAKAYVTGRYHPGIMASIGGTPCVFIESNSHKTLSLQHVMGYEPVIEHSIKDNNGTINAIIDDLISKINMEKELRFNFKTKSLQNAQSLNVYGKII